MHALQIIEQKSRSRNNLNPKQTSLPHRHSAQYNHDSALWMSEQLRSASTNRGNVLVGGEDLNIPAGGWKRGWLGAMSAARVSNNTITKLQQIIAIATTTYPTIATTLYTKYPIIGTIWKVALAVTNPLELKSLHSSS